MGRVLSNSLLEAASWNQHPPKRESSRTGAGTLAFTLLTVVVLITVYLFFVSSRLWVVNLGYRTSEALREQTELLEVNTKLKIERATLMSPERIDSYGRKELGMRDPREDQIRFVP
jgi:cell division protein FtsL